MSRADSSEAPAWLKVAVGLGVVAVAGVAVFVGYKAAVVTALVGFLGLGAELAALGLLGTDEEPAGDGR